MRALSYLAAAAIDASRQSGDDKARYRAQRRADLLIPVVKAWCTDLGVEIASTGIQVHGGMGYIEETGAAQYLRDARIAPIYEGANGIQANDLVGRKLGRDGGEAARELFAEMRPILSEIGGRPGWESMHRGLAEGLDALEHATAYLVDADPALAAAGSSPYLALFGTVARRLADGAARARGRAARRRSRVCRGEAGDGPVLCRALPAARPRIPAGDRRRCDGRRFRSGAALITSNNPERLSRRTRFDGCRPFQMVSACEMQE